MSCWVCEKPSTLLCTRCSSTFFCSAKCSEAAWPLHRKLCHAEMKSDITVIQPLISRPEHIHLRNAWAGAEYCCEDCQTEKNLWNLEYHDILIKFQEEEPNKLQEFLIDQRVRMLCKARAAINSQSDKERAAWNLMAKSSNSALYQLSFIQYQFNQNKIPVELSHDFLKEAFRLLALTRLMSEDCDETIMAGLDISPLTCLITTCVLERSLHRCLMMVNTIEKQNRKLKGVEVFRKMYAQELVEVECHCGKADGCGNRTYKAEIVI